MTLSRLATSALYERYTPSGIAGYGGWASVTATTGSPTTYTYNDGTVDWIAYEWTGSGSVTTTAGVVDVLVVGGGGGKGTSSTVTAGGGAGGVTSGLRALSAATHTVTVGAGGAAGTNYGATGGSSSLGLVTAGGGGGGHGLYNGVTYVAPSYTTGGGYAGGLLVWNSAAARDGMGSATSGVNPYDGIVSDITGTSVEYSVGGNQYSAETAYGSGGSANNVAIQGVVIIRVPVNPELWGAPPTQGVLPNLNVGWASVTAATGTFTKGSYTDSDGQWTYWQWTGAGSVTTTAGVVDTLIVGGGGQNATYGGYGGYSVTGLQQVAAQAHSVAVGTYAGYGNGGRQGGESSLGAIVARGGAGGAQSYASGMPGLDGFTSSITGTSLTYARIYAASASRANSGDGGSTSYVGAAGVVIVRVPTAFDLT